MTDQSEQEQVYNLSSHKIVNEFIQDGMSATIFAYGQTGAGKTYTIIGKGIQSGNKKSKANKQKLRLMQSDKKGILPRVIDQLYNTKTNGEKQFVLSFFEIYNDKVYDLLKIQGG